jgi:hypothetical protein
MRVAVTGSWRDEDATEWKLRDKDGFFTAVASLGAEIAKLGHRLVVATDSRQTADRAAVDGAERASGQGDLLYEPVVDLLRNSESWVAQALDERATFNARGLRVETIGFERFQRPARVLGACATAAKNVITPPK